MAIALWVVQGLLAAMFLMAGSLKTFSSREKLSPNMPWVDSLSAWQMKAIGIVELAAALGLILPMVTGIAPILTPLAAVGLVVTMIGAIYVHAIRKEPQGIVMNIVILALALFVAYGRFVLMPVVA